MAVIRIDARDGAGDFAAYLAETPGARAGIVVVQEILGVNAGIREMTESWAAQGYTAIAPDLFWRIVPGVELDADKPDDFKQALDLLGGFDIDKGILDIEAAIKSLRARGCSKVGVVGYCLGGQLAYLSATRTDSDATVGYYGVNIDKYLGEQHAIGKPLMLHNAALDHFVTAEAKAAVRSGLAANPHVTLHDYQADHAFARVGSKTRVPELADEADARTTAFFRANLA